MSDLIDRQSVVNEIDILLGMENDTDTHKLKMLRKVVKDVMPSAIIRCTDCTKLATEACPMYICDGWMTNDLDDYCSYADKVTERGKDE